MLHVGELGDGAAAARYGVRGGGDIVGKRERKERICRRKRKGGKKERD